MKQTVKAALSLLLVLACAVCLAACSQAGGADLWEQATYQTDTELGQGSTELVVEVKAGDKTVTFTLNTDKTTVGAALLEHGLIAGDESPSGLYIKAVNGITADYDVDKTYWAFYINGEYAMTGVDATDITAGSRYRLERAK